MNTDFYCWEDCLWKFRRLNWIWSWKRFFKGRECANKYRFIFAGRIIVEVSQAQLDAGMETFFLRPRMIRQAHQDCANEYRFLLLMDIEMVAIFLAANTRISAFY